MLIYVEPWWPSWTSDRHTIHKFSTEPPNDHSCKVTIELAWWFLTRRFFKISDNENTLWTLAAMLNFKWAPNLVEDHPMNIYASWFKSVQWFQRRRLNANGRRMTTNGYPWQKLTWPTARWAKNKYFTLRSKVKVPRSSLWYETHRIMVMHLRTIFQSNFVGLIWIIWPWGQRSRYHEGHYVTWHTAL